MNPESIDMWIEYLRMELGFVETVRRRWETLGIRGEEEGARVVMEGGIVESVISSAGKGKSGWFFLLVENVADVRLAVCRLEMFSKMEQVIRDYPSPENLQTKLLKHLDSEGRHMDGSAVAVGFHAANGDCPSRGKGIRMEAADK